MWVDWVRKLCLLALTFDKNNLLKFIKLCRVGATVKKKQLPIHLIKKIYSLFSDFYSLLSLNQTDRVTWNELGAFLLVPRFKKINQNLNVGL